MTNSPGPHSPGNLLRASITRRFPLTGWLWRGVGYALTTAVVALAADTVLSCLAAPLFGAVAEVRKGGPAIIAAMVAGLFGIALLGAAGPPLAVVVARIERYRLRLADDRPVIAPPTGALYLAPATWRACAYLLFLAIIGPLWLGVLGLFSLVVVAFVITPITLPMTPHAPGYGLVIGPLTAHNMGTALAFGIAGVLLIPVLLWVTGLFSGVHAAVARALLTAEPDPSGARLVEVTRSRARLMDAFDAERRRIERDLHDGAQQRLVGLTMQLSLAEMDLPADSPAAAAVAVAHEHAKALMVELRDLIHGIDPRTLAELGLPAALEELAATSAVPVDLRADIGRLPAPTERVAYFAISEALANVAKHAEASRARVTVIRTGDRLDAEITDDGRGGADPERGSGLTGLADRVAAAGGRLLLSSPAGEGTRLRIELPCGS